MAPIRGWNTRDALSAMKEGFAPQLDNYFPDESGCTLRRGMVSWATGLTGAVESLMPYTSPTTAKLFAADSTQVYNVTATGAVGAAELTGLANGRWQYANFGTGGTTYLLMVNGADSPRRYNGSAWSTAGLTGMTSTQLEHVNVFKSRLFFIQKDSMSAWYLAANAISGALSQLSFAEQAVKGGYLMAMATWTVDGGSGADDYAVFVTSEGEAIVYAGTDPSSASTWALKGVYSMAPPIGRRCFVKYGGDVALLTRDGLVPLSLALTEQDKGDSRIALSDNIAPTWSSSVRLYGDTYGWSVVSHPTSRMMVVNVPIAANAVAYQYVMNTTTRAWCRFRGWNANCFVVFDNELYYGGDGAVYKADTGTGDSGNTVDIVGEGVDAFTYFGNATSKKQVTMMRPNIQSDSPLTPTLGIDTEFNIRPPTINPSALADNYATWDVSDWDVADWAGGLFNSTGWQSVTCPPAYAIAAHVKTSTKIQTVNWISTDYLLLGGAVGV